MNFLPEDYKSPNASNNYVKLQAGENKFRILSKPILGWEDWKDNKPVRFAFSKKPLKPIDPAKPIKHFWAFIVYNYDVQAIQILSITQAGIRNNLEALCKDSDWGDPYFYDIKIIKSGEGKDTNYKVNPLPHKPVSDEIKKAYADKKCYLPAHLECMDPFALEWPNFTQGIFSREGLSEANKSAPIENKGHSGCISEKEAYDLNAMLSICSPEYQKTLMDKLSKLNPPVLTFDRLPIGYYAKVREDIVKNSQEMPDELPF